MGPRHTTSDLDAVLTEPMLSSVRGEACAAARAGWFWNIRPSRVKVRVSVCCVVSGKKDGD